MNPFLLEKLLDVFVDTDHYREYNIVSVNCADVYYTLYGEINGSVYLMNRVMKQYCI